MQGEIWGFLGLFMQRGKKMFNALKDNKIIAYNKTGKFPRLVYDRIEEVEDAEMVEVGGEFVLKTDDKAIAKQKNDVRGIRNSYLATTDIYMLIDFPISEEEKENYKTYRVYLRNYTEQEDWWESEPLTYEEWKETI